MPLIPSTPYPFEGLTSWGRHPSHLHELIDKHATLIGRGFGITDRRFNHLGHSGLGEVMDTVAIATIINRHAPDAVITRYERLGVASATAPIRVPPAPELEMTARICVPIRVHDILLGYLWLMDEPAEPLDPAKVAAAGRAALEIGAELYRLRDLERAAYTQDAVLLTALCSDGGLDEDILQRLEQRLTHAASYVAIVIDSSESCEDAGPVETRLRTVEAQMRRTHSAGDILAAFSDGRGLLAVALTNTSDAEHEGDSVLSPTSRAGAPKDCAISVGVGGSVPAMEDLQTSFSQAKWCVQIARQRGPGSNSVSWASLGADRTIVAMLRGRDPMQFMPESVRRLLETKNSDPVLVDTLWRYLESAGDAQATAQALFVHRSTIYHRLHRIQDITERDLARGDDRLELHFGLRLSRLIPLSAAN
jgi:hypothetical protein